MPQVEKYEAPRLGQVVTLNVGFMERLLCASGRIVNSLRAMLGNNVLYPGFWAYGIPVAVIQKYDL